MNAVPCAFLGRLLLLLLCRFPSKLLAQSSLEGDDSSCLSGFQSSVHLTSPSWSPSSLSSPCPSPAYSPLVGITCNRNRVFSLILNSSNLLGSIPPSLSNCTYLQILDLSSNQLSGPIPPSLSNLTYLTTFNLSNNRLSGPLPAQLANCVYLNIIDLHQNQLSGSIPAQLGLLQRLKTFDVSDNQLSGPVPSTLSNTSTGAPRFNASSFRGNKDLYGFPLPLPTIHTLSVVAIVGIGLASGLVSLIVSFTAVCVWLRVTEQGFAAQEGKIPQLES